MHPPERRRRGAGVAACCCCCCSCCLHSVGGLIGAAAAGRSRAVEEESATAAYWISFLALLVITFGWSILAGGDLGAPLLIVALVLPGYQIAASAIAAVISGIHAGSAALPRIWTITWRGLLGAAMGFAIMLALYFGGAGKLDAMLLVVLCLVQVPFFLHLLRRKQAETAPGGR